MYIYTAMDLLLDIYSAKLFYRSFIPAEGVIMNFLVVKNIIAIKTGNSDD